MKKYKVYQIDSFTDKKFTGNPAGVVPDAEGLTEEQMLSIAREMNNSETAFIFETPAQDYDVEVRFFTPVAEVPICGHATVASHYVRAMEKGLENCRVVQKTKAGILPVDIEKTADGYNVTMTQGEVKIHTPFDAQTVEDIAQALGITVQDIRSDCPVTIASTGFGKVMVGIKCDEMLHNLKPDMSKLIEISKRINCNGYYVFTISESRKDLVHGRMFAPVSGINEDPVTGNANGPLGAYLVYYGIVPNDGKYLEFSIEQGRAMGRCGNMTVMVDIAEGKPTLVKIKGGAVAAFCAEIEL